MKIENLTDIELFSVADGALMNWNNVSRGESSVATGPEGYEFSLCVDKLTRDIHTHLDTNLEIARISQTMIKEYDKLILTRSDIVPYIMQKAEKEKAYGEAVGNIIDLLQLVLKGDLEIQQILDNGVDKNKIKVLYFGIQPGETSKISIGQEISILKDEKLRADQPLDIEISPHFAVNLSNVSRAIINESPDIIHFSSHGDRIGNLIIADGTGNNEDSFKLEHLAQIISLSDCEIKAILLNACYSAVAINKLSQVSDKLIGTNRAISDQAACEFTRGFYQAIFSRRSVEQAFELGKVHVSNRFPDEAMKYEILS